MSYRLTKRTIEELKEIQAYIAHEKQNPAGAEVVERYLFEAFDKIASDPARCGARARPQITLKPYKFLTVRKYGVVYDDRSTPIWIVGVVGGRRNLARMFATDARFATDEDEA